MSKQPKVFHIETQDGAASLNFFTSAKSHKAALRNVMKNSWDFKYLVKNNRDLTITIKLLK